MAGKVWLVGAGPGDVGLLTQKGCKILKSAEVVVYDSLVSDEVLALIPADARKIDAGKRANNHKMKQEDTNQLLLDEALAGNNVVRLKGGDPFLFGRGGEELELLEEHGISYEVVPGITSAIAVPAYNGIPVTHRDFCSSVHIITGHKRQENEYDIDFEALVRTKGTLVFLMGISSLKYICGNLIKAGMDKNTPAAVLQEGTTAGQRRVVATVGTLTERAEEEGIGAPGIIVVGKVCSLADTYCWREKMPLFGVKVLVTRPAELSSGMAEKLREKGAEVLELPAIKTEAIADNERLKKAFDGIKSYEWLAFTSPTGVRVFFEEMKKTGMDVRKLGHMGVAVLGEGTRKELEKYGIFPDVMPKIYDGRSLGAALAEKAEPSSRILLPRASKGNSEILEELKGFEVDDIPTYDTLDAALDIIDIQKEMEEGKIDCAAYTSSSSVRAFARAFPEMDYSIVNAACIGRQTMETAQQFGMKCFMSEKASIDSLVEAIIRKESQAAK